MKFRFWKKATDQPLLETKGQRLYNLTKAKREELLADKTIDDKKKLDQLVKENAELKVLADSLQDELSLNLRAGGNYVFEVSSNAVEIIPKIKVLQDSQLEYHDKQVDIDAPDKVVKFPRFGRPTQCRAWFVEKEGEYTYDPRDETPIEIKKRSESIIKVKNEMAKASFIQNILRGLEGAKKWFEYIPWIVFGATIVLFSIAVFWWLGGYTLIKAG